MGNINQFKSDLRKFADSLGIGLETVIRKLSLEVFTGVVQKTPVDKGRARASWVIALETPISSPNLPEDRQMSASEAGSIANRQLSKLSQIKPFSTVFISNSLPYIGELEDGSSRQAPEGMVAVTLAEVNRNLPRVERDFPGRQ